MKRKLDLGDNVNGGGQRLGFAAGGNANSENTPSRSRWTSRPFSARYYDILRKRQQLPVYEFKDELIHKVMNNQVIIVEGETGSGKVSLFILLLFLTH
jgi:HrpA-like RNA helicase